MKHDIASNTISLMRSVIAVATRNIGPKVRTAFKTCQHYSWKMKVIASKRRLSPEESKVAVKFEDLEAELSNDVTEYDARIDAMEAIVAKLQAILDKPANKDKKNPQYSDKQDRAWQALVKKFKSAEKAFDTCWHAAASNQDDLKKLVKQAGKLGIKI